MNVNLNTPGEDQVGPDGTQKHGKESEMGNDLSMGNVSGTGISDFDPDVDSPETEEKEYNEGGSEGDDQRSDDNGINPAPAEVDPKKSAEHPGAYIENADEDKLNPFPDELRPNHDDDKDLNSTWMISGRNRKI